MAQLEELKQIRQLFVQTPTQSGRPSFVAAASGCVKVANELFVIADDELSLARFDLASAQPGQFFSIAEELPLPPKERKKVKPDFEALSLISILNEKSILALPSGSKPQRSLGRLFSMADLASRPRWIDFSPLYQELIQVHGFKDLNLEGLVVGPEETFLFQRGNSENSFNALIRMSTGEFLNDLQTNVISEGSLLDIIPVELGSIQGCPLTFTDATTWGDQMLFVAAAEATTNTYDDGAFVGAAIGIVDSYGDIHFKTDLPVPYKPEGICQYPEKSPNSFLLVTDADDLQTPSLVYEGTLCR